MNMDMVLAGGWVARGGDLPLRLRSCVPTTVPAAITTTMTTTAAITGPNDEPPPPPPSITTGGVTVEVMPAELGASVGSDDTGLICGASEVGTVVGDAVEAAGAVVVGAADGWQLSSTQSHTMAPGVKRPSSHPVCSNARGAMVTPAGSTADRSAEHPLNARFPTSLTESCRSIDASRSQSRNAPAGISVMEIEIVTDTRLLHSKNASVPRVATEFGITTDTSELHCLNAWVPISSTDGGICICVKFT